MPGANVVLGMYGRARLGPLAPSDDAPALGGAVVSTRMDDQGAARRADVARARFLQRFMIDTVADEMIRFYELSLGGSVAA